MRTLSDVTSARRKTLALLLASILALAFTGFSRPATAEPAGPQAPEATCPAGGQCFADVLPGSPFYDYANTLYKQDIISGYPCGGPGEPCDGQNRPYYRPAASVTRAQMTKFVDLARKQPGIRIDTTTHTQPLYVRTTALSGIAIIGESTDADGVRGLGAIGVQGASSKMGGIGVRGGATNGIGVLGFSTSSYAGYFDGNVYITDMCTGCTGPSMIDHPVDPANKYLYHSPVQSPDMKNIYDGVAVLDANGEAVVVLPAYFEALNRDFRYQFAPIGASMPNLYIAEEIKHNSFKLAGGKAGMKVSWQVTGTRQDPYSEQHRTPVEQDKPQAERGLYLHPEVYGQPESKQLDKLGLPQLPSTAAEPDTQP